MKKTLLSLLCMGCSSMMLAQTATTWKISVQNQGTAGGYILDKQMKSTERVGYSSHYPMEGYMPAWYIRFPKGTFTVKSTNRGTIDVAQMDKAQDIATAQPANDFTFRAPADGWYRFVLRGAQPYSELHDFTISSTDAKGANAVYLAAWRSVPSLHLNGFGSSNGKLPAGDSFNWIYNEVQIPDDADYKGTYVEAFGFAKGYVGIQNNGKMDDGKTNHTVIFSTWDNGDTDSDASLAGYKRSGVIAIDSTLKRTVAERFGGEGTGVHVLLNGDYWKPGHWVRFLLNVQPEQIQLKDGSNYDNTIISAWYNVRGIDDKWHYISSQRMAGQVQYFGSGFNSFLEEFTRGATSQGHMPHKAYYRRVFTRSMLGGEWFNRNQFHFGHTDGGTDKGARNDRYQTQMVYDGEPAAYMQSGGYIEPKAGTPITLKYLQPGDFLPSDEALAQLHAQYVAPAIQRQDIQRMNALLSDVYTEIPQKEWKVTGFSSEETVGEKDNGRAAFVLDGKLGTFWHSEWMSKTHNHYPHYIDFKHQGEVQLSRIVLVNEAKHSSSNYRARTVSVQVADPMGGWKTQSVYGLANADQQEIILTQTLKLSDGQGLRLRFTEGYGQGEGFMAIAEVGFEGKNPDRLRELVAEQYAKADQWNHYPKTDVEKYLGEVNDRLNTATEKELSHALVSLAQKGKVIKYVPIDKLSSLNAERCYVLTNAEVSGTLVQPLKSASPSLRNVDEKMVKDAQEAYKQATSVTEATSNWLIVGDDRPGNTAQYVVYNLQSGQFLQPGNGDAPATMSETPAKIQISRRGIGFSLSNTTGKRSPLVAHPTAPEGQELTGKGSLGAAWRIFENLYLQPKAALVKALRDYLKTGKFVVPTGIGSLHSAADASANPNDASAALFDLSGRRITTPTAGQVVISKQGKSVQTH